MSNVSLTSNNGTYSTGTVHTGKYDDGASEHLEGGGVGEGEANVLR